MVLNKADVINDSGQLEMLQILYPDAICISAKTGLGLDELTNAVLARYKGNVLVVKVSSHQSNGKVQSFLRSQGAIVSEEYRDGFVDIEAKLGRNQLVQLKKLRPDELEIID